jgi:hypothetical protein
MRRDSKETGRQNGGKGGRSIAVTLHGVNSKPNKVMTDT